MYIIEGIPTLVQLNRNPINRCPYAQVLKAGYDGMPADKWLDSLGEKLKADFPKLSHIYIEPNGHLTKLPKSVCYWGLKPINARYTVVNDLQKDQESIFAACSKSHRQNIRKAEQAGLIVETYDSGDLAVDRFCAVMNAVSTSKNYIKFELDYYRKVWRELSENQMAYISVGSLNSEDIGAYMVAYANGAAYQFYGGRTQKGRDLKLAQGFAYQTFMHAKKLGLGKYDMWGIAQFDQSGQLDPNDELYGIGQFKVAFGGEKQSSGQSFSVVYNRFNYHVFVVSKSLQQRVISLRKKLFINH